MNNKIIILSIFGTLAVAIGAFGAHGLKPYLTDIQQETFKTGSFYHFVHLMPMLVIALYTKESKAANQSFYLYLAGIICFSGSLYVLSTKHLYGGDMWNFIGPITPIGGIFFIAAWLNLVRVKDLTP